MKWDLSLAAIALDRGSGSVISDGFLGFKLLPRRDGQGTLSDLRDGKQCVMGLVGEQEGRIKVASPWWFVLARRSLEF